MAKVGERTRSRAEGPVLEDLTWLDASSGEPEGTVECTMHTKIEQMDDVVTDNYHSRSENGEIINNPCVYTLYQSTATGGGSYLAYDAQGNPAQTSTGGSVTLALCSYHNVPARQLLTIGAGAKDLAVESARAKAISHVDSTPYAFLEDTLEVRETLRFLRNPLEGLRKLSRSFDREVRSRRDLGTRLDAISDVYLQYRFAASPLVKSAFEIYDSLADDNWKRPKRRTARGFSEASRQGAELAESANNKGYFLDSRREVTYKVAAGILYEVNNPLRDVNFKTGMRFKDVPEGIWAVMPYSFMIDRIVDISGGIRGLTNLLDPNVTILSGWTTKRSESTTVDRASHQEHPTVQVDITGDPVQTREFGYERTPWSPSTSDAVPPSDLRGLVADTTKILDLAALIYRNFGSGRLR